MAEDRLKALLAIAEAQPTEVMIWYGLANEYVKLERWAEAVDALRRTLAINADYTSAYQMLGTALMKLGQRDEAGKCSESARDRVRIAEAGQVGARFALVPEQAAHTAHAFHDRPVGRVPPVGTVLAETGQRHEHEARVHSV